MSKVRKNTEDVCLIDSKFSGSYWAWVTLPTTVNSLFKFVAFTLLRMKTVPSVFASVRDGDLLFSTNLKKKIFPNSDSPGFETKPIVYSKEHRLSIKVSCFSLSTIFQLKISKMKKKKKKNTEDVCWIDSKSGMGNLRPVGRMRPSACCCAALRVFSLLKL